MEIIGKKVSARIREGEDEQWYVAAVQQALQGQWTNWADYTQRELGWRTLMTTKPSLVRFVVGATFNTLNSPSNLRRWGLEEDASCYLCEVVNCTVRHVLSGCTVSLGQGRYRYRHDKVLACLADRIDVYLKSDAGKKKSRNLNVKFVREGTKESRATRSRPGLLDTASDWELSVDLKRMLVFPTEIIQTKLRPDIVLFSKSIRHVVMIELTCLCEENFAARHEANLDRHAELAAKYERLGWKSHLFAVEVGARGYAAKSVVSCLSKLGLSTTDCRSVSSAAADTALRTSFWIWVRRENEEWGVRDAKQVSTRYRKRTLKSKQKASGQVQRSGVIRKRDCFAGLKNIGNTCYMNAVIQAISVVAGECNGPSSGIGIELGVLFRKMSAGSDVISPSGFWRLFSTVRGYRTMRRLFVLILFLLLPSHRSVIAF